jgi:hypothetical protein
MCRTEPFPSYDEEKEPFAILFIQSMQEVLTERQSIILQYRYGLLDGDAHTLTTIGDLMGVSRERIRQIEVKTLQKLRNAYRPKQASRSKIRMQVIAYVKSSLLLENSDGKVFRFFVLLFITRVFRHNSGEYSFLVYLGDAPEHG